MASKSPTRESLGSRPPVVGFGFAVVVTLAAGIAVGLLAVVVVG